MNRWPRGLDESGDIANFVSRNSYLFRNYHVQLFGTTFEHQIYYEEHATLVRKIRRFQRNKVKYVLQKCGHFFSNASKLFLLRGIHVCFPSSKGQRTIMIKPTTEFRYCAIIITTTIENARASNEIKNRHVCYFCVINLK